MTFTADMRLTIEIHDLIKSRGGKMTVYKDLALKQITKMREEDEQEYNLSSQMQDYLWEDGWNFAECEDLCNPIPLIVTSGYTAGAGMIHCWLEKQNEWCIPMEARVEDFHFAGYMPTSALVQGLTPQCTDEIHMGFKKLYLYKVDKELGIKHLLERGIVSTTQQKLFWQSMKNFGCQPNSQLQQQLQAAGITAPMLGAGFIGNSLGGFLGGNGKQTSPYFDDLNHHTYRPSAHEHFGRISKWIKRVITQTRWAHKSSNP